LVDEQGYDISIRNDCVKYAQPLGIGSTENQVAPVMFSLGRFMAVTRPVSTGSPPVMNTMGIVVVVAFAADIAIAPIAAMIVA
jgi:hypothetical protein